MKPCPWCGDSFNSTYKTCSRKCGAAFRWHSAGREAANEAARRGAIAANRSKLVQRLRQETDQAIARIVGSVSWDMLPRVRKLYVTGRHVGYLRGYATGFKRGVKRRG